MKKLVRDNIPRIMIAQGKEPLLSVCQTTDEKLLYLGHKILEEAAELSVALGQQNKQAAIEEFADVLEVLDAIQLLLGVSSEEIDDAQSEKRYDRGGFTSGFLLEIPGSD